ncbi:MAG TPA: BadF/BadG/BcrA/BcrD ATPase family protein [Ktedonobacterales bacterium]
MSAARTLWAGVDAGGSKTLAVVVDARGCEVGRGLAGGANYQSIGLERAVASLRGALDTALRAAGYALPLTAAWIGMAGIDRAADRDLWLPHLVPLAGAGRLTNDAELALTALDGAVGVAVVAGTGSIALGRDARGATARSGGWGHLIGDEGSGYDIGRSCLQAVTRAADGRGPPTTLVDLLAHTWGLNSPTEIIGRVYPAEDKASIAQLATLVFAAARAGDGVARRIVARAAGELSRAAIAVHQALEFADTPLPLALAGGLLVNESRFRAQVVRRIGRSCALGQVAVVEEPALSAARAAVRLGTGSGWRE